MAALDILGIAGVEYLKPIPHVRHGSIWHLGRERADFGGTDALAMNINPIAIKFVRDVAAHEACPPACDIAGRPSVILGEGDRLANNTFLAACPNLTLIYLAVPIEEARHRASIRARALGKPEQSLSWWKGRVTKVRNLVASRPTITLDGMGPAAKSAAELADLLR